MILRITPTSALVTAMAVALVTTLYALLARGPATLPTGKEETGGAPAVVTDFTFTETKGGQTHWLMKARRARYFERDNRVEVEAIRADLRDGERVLLHLEATSGHVDLASFTFDLTGGVRITDPDGLRLTTPQLHFDGPTRRLTGDGPLDLHRPPYQIAGGRFTYNVTTHQLTVEEAVHLVVTPPAAVGAGAGTASVAPHPVADGLPAAATFPATCLVA